MSCHDDKINLYNIVHLVNINTIFKCTSIVFLADSVKIFTKNDVSYKSLHRSMVGRNFTTFRVKASSDARIALSNIHGNIQPLAYEVHIGAASNSKTLLLWKVNGQELAVHETSGILDNSQLKAFWISWQDGVIEVGEGSEPQPDTLLSWTDPKPVQIQSIAVATGLESQGGEWEFDEEGIV